MNNSKVPFTVENIERCMCPGCPVQTHSKCVNLKQEKFDEIIKRVGKGSKSEDVPALYCSSGMAACKDLDFRQMCICGSCAVWKEYKLVSRKPVYYFCKSGRAQ